MVLVNSLSSQTGFALQCPMVFDMGRCFIIYVVVCMIKCARSLDHKIARHSQGTFLKIYAETIHQHEI